jgi:hypothetical protein
MPTSRVRHRGFACAIPADDRDAVRTALIITLPLESPMREHQAGV